MTLVSSRSIHPQVWDLPEVQPSVATSEEIRSAVKKAKKLQYLPYTLDSGKSAVDPSAGLLSKKDLRSVDKSKPVVLLVHGYTATPYEWSDFARYIDQNGHGAIHYSNILLGGHGKSYAAFKKSSWQDWGAPIVDEYKALVAKGFKNISIAGVSTACPLILEQLDRSAFSYNNVRPRNIFMIDPIVEPKGGRWEKLFISTMAFLGGWWGPTQAFSPEEFSRWYANRPFCTIKSLNELTERVQKAMQRGIQLPGNTNLSVWASQGDPTVNPDGYKLIQQGVRVGRGGTTSFSPVDSPFHVFTRLSGRPASDIATKLTKEQILKHVLEAPIGFTHEDLENQKRTFDAIIRQMVA